ncbi:MAG: DUF5916 domain-containing protein [Candidatus Eisenbacteria bacterium]
MVPRHMLGPVPNPNPARTRAGPRAASDAGISAFVALAFAVALTLAAPLATPSDAGPRYLGSRGEIRLTLPRVDRAPSVDGALDDSVWTEAAVLDSFVQNEPVDGMRDTLGTRCFALYDGRELYLGFRCDDRPGGVRAPLVPRDKVDEGDFVAVAIDGFYDFQRALVFGANPLGVQLDGVDVEGSDFDDAPDFQYRSRGRLTATGYEVEIAVPFRSLRFPERDSVTLGFNAVRYVARDDATLFWAPISQDQVSTHAQQGTLAGLTGIRPGRDLQIVPGITALRLGELDQGRLEFEDPRTRLSLDVKSAVGSSFTADATVNPDFSQVEADAGVVDVNERFAIYFPEKRPFFLEGGDLFTTTINVVYTRRIADPRYGLKLTGHTGGTTVAVLHAMDRGGGESVETLPDVVNPYFDRDALFDIVRLKRDLGGGSSAGLLAGHREQHGSYNRTLGLDTRLLWRDHYRFEAQATGSESHDRDYRDAFGRLTPAEAAEVDSSLLAHRGERANGYAFHIESGRETRGLGTGFFLDDFSRRFAADMGFIRRVNQINGGFWIEPHILAKQEAWFTGIHPEFFYERTWEHGDERYLGRLTDELIEFENTLNLPHNSELGARWARQFTYFAGEAFPEQYQLGVSGSSERWNSVRFGGEVNLGDVVIFDEGVAGRGFEYEGWVHLRPNPQLKVELSLKGSAITRRETNVRFADDVIPRLRVNYQFTRELAVRAITELQAERRFDTAGVLEDDERRVTLDLLASWLLRPGTVVHLGYGAGLEGRSVAGARPTTSNLFFKASWLWQR